MSGYIGSTPVPQATQHRESFTATAGQTSFATAGYTPQFVDVYLNGVHLSPADVTATNGSDVVLVACLVNDIVDVVSYTPFEVANQTFTGNNIMTNGDNTTQLTLISTDADANTGPKLDLTRNSASPAANDILGNIRFMGEDSAGNSLSYIGIFGQLIDPTDGSEDGSLEIDVRLAGTNRSRIISNATETVFNDDSVDLDFRVESDNQTHALFVQGSDGFVGIGVNTPGAPLHIEAADNANLLRFTVTGQEDWAFKGASVSKPTTGNDTISFGIVGGNQAMTWDELGICTKPLQPAFSVNKNNTTQSNLATGDTAVTVIWAAERFDQNSNFDLTNNRFVAPVTGKYQLQCNIRLHQTDSAAAYNIITIKTSNLEYSFIFDPDVGQDQTYWSVTTSVLADMDADDTATVIFAQNGGAAQTDIEGANGYTYFTGYLVA